MSSCKDVSSCYQLMFIDYLGLNRAYVTFNRLMLSWIWYPRWSRINQISLLKILTLRTLLMSRVLWEDLFIFYDQMTLTNSIWYGISASECVCVLWSVSFAYLTVTDLVWLEAGVSPLWHYKLNTKCITVWNAVYLEVVGEDLKTIVDLNF